MKTFEILFGVLFISSLLNAQEPPPRLIIEINKNFLCDFEIKVNATFLQKLDVVKSEEQHYNENFLYFFLVNKQKGEILYPKKGSLISINVKKRYFDKNMIIYFRLCNDLGPNIDINISNLHFKRGLFFYDMCSTTNIKYSIDYSWLCPKKSKDMYLMSNELSVTNLKFHKISKRKLNHYIKKYKCE